MNKIKEKKANIMISKILDLEKENLKTKKYNDYDMIEKVKKIIEEEVKKCY